MIIKPESSAVPTTAIVHPTSMKSENSDHDESTSTEHASSRAPLPEPTPTTKPSNADHDQSTSRKHGSWRPSLPDVHFHCLKMNSATDRIISSLSQSQGLSKFLHLCIHQVIQTLYPHRSEPFSIRSISFYLDHMDGVAYTKSSDLDSDHKEIHLSIRYFSKCPNDRLHAELEGVLVHEIVHCYQYNAHNTAPSGIIEGIADLVRLYSALAPPHWNPKEKGTRWDAGYQHTAYFLAWLDRRYGDGHVGRNLNEGCKHGKWSDEIFFELTGEKVEDLWEKYVNEDEKSG